jgi:hypothetical protein
MGYRLGGDPVRHGVTDCVGLARTVLDYYGIVTPVPKRSWYRRLRKGDTTIFPEQLRAWGIEVEEPRLGAVGLCRSEFGYGLAVWWSEGWLSYRLDQVAWSPPGVLEVCGIYCRSK